MIPGEVEIKGEFSISFFFSAFLSVSLVYSAFVFFSMKGQSYHEEERISLLAKMGEISQKKMSFILCMKQIDFKTLHLIEKDLFLKTVIFVAYIQKRRKIFHPQLQMKISDGLWCKQKLRFLWVRIFLCPFLSLPYFNKKINHSCWSKT